MKGEHPGGQKGQVGLLADPMGYTGRFDGSSSYSRHICLYVCDPNFWRYGAVHEALGDLKKC